jgi:hypothetical protein
MAKRESCQVQLDKVRARLYRAMNAADRRGYTGMLHSKGGLFDDPRVKAIKRRYDHVIDRCRS